MVVQDSRVPTTSIVRTTCEILLPSIVACIETQVFAQQVPRGPKKSKGATETNIHTVGQGRTWPEYLQATISRSKL